MISQKLKAKKAEKARAIKRKYKKIINIKRNNEPKKSFVIEQPVMRSETNEKTGKVKYRQIGIRMVKNDLPSERLRAGEGKLPVSRKFKSSKK